MKLCLVVYGCPYGLCRASVRSDRSMVFWLMPCQFSMLHSVHAGLSLQCWVLPAFVAVWQCLYSNLGVGLPVPILLYEYLHRYTEGFQSSVLWCSWLLLPKISRLACPAGWVGLTMGLFRLCIFDIRYKYGNCIFSTLARGASWCLPRVPSEYWPSNQVCMWYLYSHDLSW